MRGHVGIHLANERRHARHVRGRLARAAELLAVHGRRALVRAHDVRLYPAVGGWSKRAVTFHVGRIEPRRRAHRQHRRVRHVRRIIHAPLGVFEFEGAAEIANLHPRGRVAGFAPRHDAVLLRERRKHAEYHRFVWIMPLLPILIIHAGGDDAPGRIYRVQVHVAARAAPDVVPAHLEHRAAKPVDLELVGLVARLEFDKPVGIGVRVSAAPSGAVRIAGGIHPQGAAARRRVHGARDAVLFRRHPARRTFPGPNQRHVDHRNALANHRVNRLAKVAGRMRIHDKQVRARRHVRYRFRHRRSVNAIRSRQAVHLAPIVVAQLPRRLRQLHADALRVSPKARIHHADSDSLAGDAALVPHAGIVRLRPFARYRGIHAHGYLELARGGAVFGRRLDPVSAGRELVDVQPVRAGSARAYGRRRVSVSVFAKIENGVQARQYGHVRARGLVQPERVRPRVAPGVVLGMAADCPVAGARRRARFGAERPQIHHARARRRRQDWRRLHRQRERDLARRRRLHPVIPRVHDAPLSGE